MHSMRRAKRSTTNAKPWAVCYVLDCAHKIKRFHTKKQAFDFASKVARDPYNGTWVDFVVKAKDLFVGPESGYYQPGMGVVE